MHLLCHFIPARKVDASLVQVLIRSACPTVLFFHCPSCMSASQKQGQAGRCVSQRTTPSADGHSSPWQGRATGLEKAIARQCREKVLLFFQS